MESQQNRHPLPPPPPGHQQQQQQQQHQNSGYQQAPYQPRQPPQQNRPPRNRAHSRGFSFRSQGSSDKENTNNLFETHNEKEAKRLHSKADPTMAMNEAEPAAIAAQARHTMGSLRMMEHMDRTGNVITDPDHSNPTRWRLERPLDTIRGFESAIRRNERSSMINAGGDNESVMSGWNPRNSYYANGSRYQHQSYYGSEAQPSRPQSGAFRADNYYDQPQQGRWGPPQQDRRRIPRTNPEVQYNQRAAGPNAYYADRSYDAGASGSGTSGPGYSGDPSSDNSSLERQQRQPEPQNDYGIGFSQDAEYQPSSFSIASNSGPQYRNPAGGAGSPQVPRKDAPMSRKPVTAAEGEPERQKKRKSWFGIGKGN